MSFDTPRRGPSRRAICFALALFLPPLAAWTTAHIGALQHIPFSLYFLSTVLIAALGGMAPSLLAVTVAVISYEATLAISHQPLKFTQVDLLRFAVLTAAAVVVSFVSESRRRSEARLQTALHTLQERSGDLVATLNSSKCACWTLDVDSGDKSHWFSGSYPVFGVPFDEIEKLPSIHPLLHPDDQPRLPELVQRMRSTHELIVFDFRVPWPDGEVHWLEMRGNRVAGPGCLWRGVTVDITDRKTAEAALLRSEKLAAMGRLASTVAHEINNPLEAVTNLLYLARTDDSMQPETQAYLATAERELSRLSNITRLTLGFVRTSGSVVDTDVAEIVDDVLYLFQHRLVIKNVRVERHYESGIVMRVAPHELRQIATNLVANAADAVGMADGCIAIHVLREQDGESERGVLLVEDNGSGIDSAHLTRIFEPFFSTKEEIGTGIGLWVTRELIEKNGGQIFVSSNPSAYNGSGTRFRTQFRVEFPLVS